MGLWLILRRLFGVCLGVSTLCFALLAAVPGDASDSLLGDNASAEERAQLRAHLGLDRPLVTRWWELQSKLIQGDWGQSVRSQRPVTTLLAERIPHTLLLAALGLIGALILALPAGAWLAYRPRNFISRGLQLASLLSLSTPTFVIALGVTWLLAVQLGWLPVSGSDRPWSWVAPSLTLALALFPSQARMIAAALEEVRDEAFLRTARAKGLGEWQVFRRHALPAACLPVLALLGMQLGSLLGGAVITETCFAWPGLGSLLIEAIQQRDFPVVQGCVLITSLLFVTVSQALDLLAGALDPRRREPSPSGSGP